MQLQLLVVASLGLAALATNDNSAPLKAMIQFDPDAEKNTEEAFQEALNEEEPALDKTPRLAAINLKVEPSQVDMPAEGAQDKVSEFEKDVTDLVLGLGQGANSRVRQMIG